MLFAVEGGGFFSSSATGYSKGLTLLLLGQKNEENPMRVSPWNQYQLVKQEIDPDLQLASGKNRVSRGCAAFICFGRASAGLDGPSPPKVGPVQQQEILQEPSVSEKGEDCNTHRGEKVHLKSSLRKPSDHASIACSDDDPHGTLGENESDLPGFTERRKVQWTDTCGKELAEVREFEPSDVGASEEESEAESERSCACVIM